MTRHFLTFALVLAALTSPALAGNNTCSLLTQSEATKFLGTPVAKVLPESDGGTQNCRYVNASNTQNVYITIDTSSDGPKQMAQLAQMHAASVPGVGAKAYYEAGSLFFQKGRVIASVAIFKGTQSMEKMESGLPALARLVFGRL